MNTLCKVEPCYIRGAHSNEGCDADCKGCLPGLALDGLRVCRHHHDRALRDLRRLPGLDHALTFALVRSSGASAEPVTGSTTPGLELNPAVFEARDLLRERLADFIAYASTERGISTPEQWTVPAMCAWLQPHHDWFCASKMAGAYVRNLGTHAGRAFSLAYPSGARKFPVGPCTEHGTDDEGARTPCTGTLTAILRDDAAMLPSELTCDGPELHTFPPHEWMALGRRLHGINPAGAQALARRLNQTA